MGINFSQYVEGEKLSVSFPMSPSTNAREKISHKERIERADKLIEKMEEGQIEGIRERIKNEMEEFVNQLIEFFQSNEHITELSFGFSFYFSKIIKTLAQSSCLQNMRKLDLDSSIDAEGVKALAESPHLQNLRHLNLSFQDINVENVKALIQSPYLKNLEKLSINN
ncbi:MAG: hypothetical protein ACR5LA_11700 [Wolbachia sp.]